MTWAINRLHSCPGSWDTARCLYSFGFCRRFALYNWPIGVLDPVGLLCDYGSLWGHMTRVRTPVWHPNFFLKIFSQNFQKTSCRAKKSRDLTKKVTWLDQKNHVTWPKKSHDLIKKITWLDQISHVICSRRKFRKKVPEENSRISGSFSPQLNLPTKKVHQKLFILSNLPLSHICTDEVVILNTTKRLQNIFCEIFLPNILHQIKNRNSVCLVLTYQS